MGPLQDRGRPDQGEPHHATNRQVSIGAADYTKHGAMSLPEQARNRLLPKLMSDESGGALMSNEHSDKIAYLQMVEDVINRMASISATFKGFAVTVFAGIPAIIFSIDGSNRALVLGLSCIGLLAIAGFDCWYFRMEKRYRKLYSQILDKSHPVDFNMSNDKSIGVNWKEAVSSKAIWLFYLILIGIDIVLILLCLCGCL